MDWLIDTADASAGTERASSLLGEHLSAHAEEPGQVEERLSGARADLADLIRAAGGALALARLEWVEGGVNIELATLDPGAVDGLGEELRPGGAVPGRHRRTLRSSTDRALGSLRLPVRRRMEHTFDAGPPPVLLDSIDLERQGAAAVAVALSAAIDAHPSSSSVQAAAIAGALLAESEAGTGKLTDGAAAAQAFVDVHRALGSEAYVVSADDEMIEVAVTRCPFAIQKGGTQTLCHVSSGLAGQLSAKVNGAATVVLDETIAAGDPECHMQVLLGGPEDKRVDGERFYFPPRAASDASAVPKLDLSVILPREGVSVPVVRRLAAQALRAFGVVDDDVDDVQLAITEACANVIDHAAETDTYDVKIELAADRCTITVVDQGSGFNAEAVPSEADVSAEQGRGLVLMHALVDNVAFRNEPMAGAVVHMVKALRYDSDHPMYR